MPCPQDAPPPDFDRYSLYAQWEFLSKHVDTHEIWSQTVLSFLASKEMRSPTQHTAPDNKVGEALQQNNQNGNAGSTKSTGTLGGDPDLSFCSFALYVRWSAKAKTTYPMSPAKLAALLKDVSEMRCASSLTTYSEGKKMAQNRGTRLLVPHLQRNSM